MPPLIRGRLTTALKKLRTRWTARGNTAEEFENDTAVEQKHAVVRFRIELTLSSDESMLSSNSSFTCEPLSSLYIQH
jgi:hypothetical protein